MDSMERLFHPAERRLLPPPDTTRVGMYSMQACIPNSRDSVVLDAGWSSRLECQVLIG